MIVPLMAALLVHAAQPAGQLQDDTTFSERQPVRLTPLPTAQALTLFRDTCMSAFPDPAALGQAVAASGMDFVLSAETDRGAREWTSRHGQILLRQSAGRTREDRREARSRGAPLARWDSRCDLWVAIEDRMEPESLVAAIGAQLAPGARAREEILGASWDLASPDSATRLRLLYLPSLDDPRIFTLSLQRYPTGQRG